MNTFSPSRLSGAARIAGLYLLLGSAWIWGSDWLVSWLLGEPHSLQQAQSWKGELFVMFTSVLLYGLVRQQERQQADEASHRLDAERRWHFAVDGSGLGLWDWNVTAGTVYFSSQWKSMLGFADHEVGDQLTEWSSRVHPDDLEQVMADVQRHLRGEVDHYVNEHRVLCKNGQYKWILDRGQVMERDAQGQALRMIGTHTDLTLLKQREEMLALNAYVFTHSSEGIVISAPDNTILSVNDAFTRISGYAADEVIGRNPSMLQSGRHDQAFYQAMWHALEAHGSWQGELWNRRKDGELYLEHITINVARNDDGSVRNYYAIFTDITQRRQAEARVQHLTHHDALTDLPNRTLLADRLDFLLRHSQRASEALALLVIDLDRFKYVNDSLGHEAGDRLLVELAQRLQQAVRQQDTLARMGGDEFALLLPQTHAEGAAHLSRQIIDLIARPVAIDGHELIVTASVGIALHPGDGHTVGELLQAGDTAMYRAKAAGGANFQFYAPEMHRNASRVLQLENQLRRALERQELALHYQPQIHLQTGQRLGCEALMRWQHPEHGSVSPAEFIPIAEQSGLIVTIGEWALRQAAQQARTWQDAGLPPLVMAVNVSAPQFQQPDFPDLVQRVLHDTGLAPRWLELEITESVVSADPEQAVATMHRLQALGVSLSVDDFGTGYSSLSYLKRFPIHKLKIDQSFVHDLTTDPSNLSIVTGIIAMAHSLGLQTVAEGVETPVQAQALQQKGCDVGQGYLYARPMPADDFARWMQNSPAPADAHLRQ